MPRIVGKLPSAVGVALHTEVATNVLLTAAPLVSLVEDFVSRTAVVSDARLQHVPRVLNLEGFAGCMVEAKSVAIMVVPSVHKVVVPVLLMVSHWFLIKRQ